MICQCLHVGMSICTFICILHVYIYMKNKPANMHTIHTYRVHMHRMYIYENIYACIYISIPRPGWKQQ